MIAYKLFRLRKDGTIGSLFINRSQCIGLDEWLRFECHPTKGYAVRPGWHCTGAPNAPHLSTKGRRWYRVEIRDYETIIRPASQGGVWYLAKWIKVLNLYP